VTALEGDHTGGWDHEIDEGGLHTSRGTGGHRHPRVRRLLHSWRTLQHGSSRKTNALAACKDLVAGEECRKPETFPCRADNASTLVEECDLGSGYRGVHDRDHGSSCLVGN
jgi:hypothetical protein